MNERRATLRRRILKSGTIEFAGGSIACAIKNISETGASLEVVPEVLVPDRFTLSVRSDKVVRPCRLVWRDEKRLGVVFT